MIFHELGTYLGRIYGWYEFSDTVWIVDRKPIEIEDYE